MSPDEMRRQASRYRYEARLLDESAQTLRAVAGSIRGLLAGLAGVSRMVWQGPAATEFEQEAETQSRHVDEQADEIAGEAANMAGRADRLRSDANRLLHEAARLEERLAATVAGGPAGPGPL